MYNYEKLLGNPTFFSDLYNYYIKGGFWCIFVENLLNIILTGFILFFVTFVLFFINWALISKCESEATCSDISTYIISPSKFYSINMNNFMIFFIVMFIIYWVFMSFVMLKDIFKNIKYRSFFVHSLRTTDDEIKVSSWNDILKKLIEHDNNLSTEYIIGSIMRRDNYIISIIGSNIFNINPIYYTHSFLLVLNICILNQIFLYGVYDKTRIKYTMIIIGIISICILPFTIIIVIIHYLVSFITDVYAKKSYIGPKEWILYAKLLFRDYNELPHIFNDRITKSYKYASQYEQKFNSHMINIIMDKLIFFLGICLTLLVLLTLYDERIVMYVSMFGRNLLWYIAIITSMISLARFVMVYPSEIEETSEEIMNNIIKYTHYPFHTNKTTNQYEILNEFRKLYKYKIIGILIEICAVFVIPFYIIIKSSDIESVLKFIENNTVRHKKLGFICRMSVIDDNNIDIVDEHEDTNSTTLLIGDTKMDMSTNNFNSYYYSIIDSDNKSEDFDITKSEINKKIEQFEIH